MVKKLLLLLILLIIVIVIVIVFILTQIIVIGIVLQLKNSNYYKLLHLINVAKICYALQNFTTRYKSNIVTFFYAVTKERPFLR